MNLLNYLSQYGQLWQMLSIIINNAWRFWMPSSYRKSNMFIQYRNGCIQYNTRQNNLEEDGFIVRIHSQNICAYEWAVSMSGLICTPFLPWYWVSPLTIYLRRYPHNKASVSVSAHCWSWIKMICQKSYVFTEKLEHVPCVQVVLDIWDQNCDNTSCQSLSGSSCSHFLELLTECHAH